VDSVDIYDLTRNIKARDVRVRACSTHGREVFKNFLEENLEEGATWRTSKYVVEWW
jgi:hypothetical protein